MLVAVPSITNTLRKNKQNKYDSFVNSLLMTTESYIESNFEKYPHLTVVGNKTAVELQDLIDSGYLKEPVINPNTNQEFDLNNVVLVTVKADKTLDYEFREENLGVSSYIKDNLLLWYDGFNKPVNRVWKDQTSQNNYGNITGGRFIDNYWRSSVSGDRIISNNAVSLGANITLELTVDNVTSIGDSDLSGMISIISNAGGYALGLGGTITLPSLKVLAGTTDIKTIALTTIPKYITMVINNTDILIYFDGVLAETLEDSQTITSVSNAVNIGKHVDNIKYVGADYYSVRVYNRALTTNEVLNNYNIDVLRYGE